MRIRNPPKFIMSISFMMSLIMTLLVFQCGASLLGQFASGPVQGPVVRTKKKKKKKMSKGK